MDINTIAAGAADTSGGLGRPVQPHPGPPRAAPRLWRTLRTEPLVHFLLLGGLIFGADAVLHPPDRTARVITVTRAMRDAMRANFDEDRQRPATDAELNAMVENWVASEILYREGKLLGVDRGDDAIRDRVAYKLQLMIFSGLDAPLATEPVLRAWFAENHARLDEPERVSFYISPPTDEAAARKHLADVLAGEDPAELQRTTRAIIGRPIPTLSASFGDAFRDGLLALPMEQWSVLESKEGWHLVRLDSRRPGEPAKFEDNQDEIVKVWQTDSTRRRAWEAVQRLRANYAVRIEP